MQFDSYLYLLYLPISIVLYFLLNKISFKVGKICLIFLSFYFYYIGTNEIPYFFFASIITNYFFSRVLRNYSSRVFLFIPIFVNTTILLYLKYTNFILLNLSYYFAISLNIKNIVLPIGISFITFQQIAYLVSINKGEINDSLIDYLTYITYFPKLLMGPLMEPNDFYNQINNKDNKHIDINNIAKGIKMFSFGLFKKVMIADIFANAVNYGFNHFDSMNSIDWVLIVLFYTIEIYFDFSGYSDMAVGSSIMFNIKLPINFDSPYKAKSFDEFWSKWHISLSSFFRKYIYIPLGGNREGIIKTYFNILIIFIISGIWHGANWTFILWGILNGILVILNKIFKKKTKKIVAPIMWIFTFVCISFLWLLFRSETILQFAEICKKIINFTSSDFNVELLNYFKLPEMMLLAKIPFLCFLDDIDCFCMFLYTIVALIILLVPKNNYNNLDKINYALAIASAILFIWAFTSISVESKFIYLGF